MMIQYTSLLYIEIIDIQFILNQKLSETKGFAYLLGRGFKPQLRTTSLAIFGHLLVAFLMPESPILCERTQHYSHTTRVTYTCCKSISFR